MELDDPRSDRVLPERRVSYPRTATAHASRGDHSSTREAFKSSVKVAVVAPAALSKPTRRTRLAIRGAGCARADRGVSEGAGPGEIVAATGRERVTVGGEREGISIYVTTERYRCRRRVRWRGNVVDDWGVGNHWDMQRPHPRGGAAAGGQRAMAYDAAPSASPGTRPRGTARQVVVIAPTARLDSRRKPAMRRTSQLHSRARGVVVHVDGSRFTRLPTALLRMPPSSFYLST